MTKKEIGMYFRISRDGRYRSVDILDLNDDEILFFLSNKTPDFKDRMILRLVEVLRGLMR